MSANRSVQAAQRRQTAPSTAAQQRGPQPSINSSQMFSQPQQSGKLSGQQAAFAQKQQQQQGQQQQQQQQQQGQGLDGITKMTVPQAITLITLRLGKLETNMFHQQYNSESGSKIDDSLIESIMDRLDAIEKRETVTSPSGTSGTSATVTSDIILLKQQFEALKPVLTQLKSASTSVAKENKILKQQIELLKNDLDETKELVITLQNITMDNSQKIMSFAFTNDSQLFSTEIVDDEDVEEEVDVKEEVEEEVSESDADIDEAVVVSEKELGLKELGLKDLVEQELNA
jgi:hypothetical protein